ncbi:hydrolase [Fragilaria crotonensis]|nr:hydrolase [Fragilaria crotonensis]
MTTTLLLIDLQKDFHPDGSLAIPTADDDAKRIVQLIRNHSSSIDRVVATLDSHHKLHIAHPCFWWDAEEKYHPDPFTIISHDDVLSGKWKPRSKLALLDSDLTAFEVPTKDGSNDATLDLQEYAKEYTKRLEAKGRFKLCIWPEHCLIGTDGHSMVDNVRRALNDWSDATGGSVEFVWKGQNLLTEMYSALEADVPVSKETSFNEPLLESLLTSKKLLVCGQAMSHCVNYTLRDIVHRWPSERRNEITLLTDCASAVPGFEDAAEQFQEDMKEAGVCLAVAANAFQ